MRVYMAPFTMSTMALYKTFKQSKHSKEKVTRETVHGNK